MKDCISLGLNVDGEQVYKTPNGSRFIVKDEVAQVLRYFPRGFKVSVGHRRFMTAEEVAAAKLEQLTPTQTGDAQAEAQTDEEAVQ